MSSTTYTPPGRSATAGDSAPNAVKIQTHSRSAHDELWARVLKHEDTFAIFDAFGDIHAGRESVQGLYQAGTRHLSRCELLIEGRRPALLSSTVSHDGSLLTVDLTNPEIHRDGEALPHGTLHLQRTKFLWNGNCYEQLRITNYGGVPVRVNLELIVDADYADVFEIRGRPRTRRGERLPTEEQVDSLRFRYEGLDGVQRHTSVTVQQGACRTGQSAIEFGLELAAQQSGDLRLAIGCDAAPVPLVEARGEAARFWRERAEAHCRIHTNNEQADEWINRSQADMCLMLTRTAHGLYPNAGIPWFNTVFGRDGLIAALQLLWVNPDIARGVLTYLARTQAVEDNPERDAEPGKILHEVRRGEMAATGQIPFQQYYGSADSTPLFVVLAGHYYEFTGDREFIEQLWPHIEAALEWVDRYGDADGDGFVEYYRRSPNGLRNQGWKDSHDSISHADGSLAEGPVALCEVQGYVYDARRRAARLARLLGLRGRADQLLNQAERLRKRFEKQFWLPRLGTYALALDGDKKPCEVISSNPGHCLFSGLISPDRARRVADSLFAGDMYTGWGVRTLSAAAARYNPMSYHNGSVWPHDNALIAEGLSRYGFKDLAERLTGDLLDAALCLDLKRFPELFCGLARRDHGGPTLYPVACAPQAWAAGTTFMLLKAMLGLNVDAENRRLVFHHPRLPAGFRDVEIANLRVGSGTVDLMLRNHPEDVGINVLRIAGSVEVIAVKAGRGGL